METSRDADGHRHHDARRLGDRHHRDRHHHGYRLRGYPLTPLTTLATRRTVGIGFLDLLGEGILLAEFLKRVDG
ncbi:MAG: hypothetical protein R3B96_00040 [Pirellulaceae bacterium]